MFYKYFNVEAKNRITNIAIFIIRTLMRVRFLVLVLKLNLNMKQYLLAHSRNAIIRNYCIITNEGQNI